MVAPQKYIKLFRWTGIIPPAFSPFIMKGYYAKQFV